MYILSQRFYDNSNESGEINDMTKTDTIFEYEINKNNIRNLKF